jgi:hypothetical protein
MKNFGPGCLFRPQNFFPPENRIVGQRRTLRARRVTHETSFLFAGSRMVHQFNLTRCFSPGLSFVPSPSTFQLNRFSGRCSHAGARAVAASAATHNHQRFDRWGSTSGPGTVATATSTEPQQLIDRWRSYACT